MKLPRVVPGADAGPTASANQEFSLLLSGVVTSCSSTVLPWRGTVCTVLRVSHIILYWSSTVLRVCIQIAPTHRVKVTLHTAVCTVLYSEYSSRKLRVIVLTTCLLKQQQSLQSLIVNRKSSLSLQLFIVFSKRRSAAFHRLRPPFVT
jgi:hypothetical protein